MENVLDFLVENFVGIMFTMSLTILLMVSGSLNKLLETTKENINESPVIYEQVEEDIPEKASEYEDIIGTLATGLSYDVEIGNITVQANSFNYLQFDYSQIPNKSYTKTIQYNEDGSINKIIYR